MKLKNSRIFWKLDMRSEFWQNLQIEESKQYTTFITSFGRYCIFFRVYHQHVHLPWSHKKEVIENFPLLSNITVLQSFMTNPHLTKSMPNFANVKLLYNNIKWIWSEQETEFQLIKISLGHHPFSLTKAQKWKTLIAADASNLRIGAILCQT